MDQRKLRSAQRNIEDAGLVAGRHVRRVLGYNGNGAHFRATTDGVAKDGSKEFVLR